jgi:hypothetical protein
MPVHVSQTMLAVQDFQSLESGLFDYSIVR